jgi:hypothetical protein
MSPILGARGGLSASAYGFTSAIPAPVTGYVSLGTTTVASANTTSSINFTVPTGYTHLVIRAMMRTSNAGTVDYIKFTYNNDNTSGRYRGHNLSRYRTTGTNGITQDYWGETQQGMIQVPGNTEEAGCFRSLTMSILEYGSTSKMKTARINGGYVNTSAYGYGIMSSELYNQTSAISSIQFAPVVGTYFAQYSIISLYGIK